MTSRKPQDQKLAVCVIKLEPKMSRLSFSCNEKKYQIVKVGRQERSSFTVVYIEKAIYNKSGSAVIK